ncbi:hypothetical protein AV521_07985 [Streptomyces sp. IMTB 2501]|uniref:FkbM family methyltransferase n=1 Tax=Streptomyces sp. IMTB 2501 TaxID=1776340 RepID=UPI00096D20CD|nr:FkbM family methyltransferase [Streptomyces sp. IMTB 2501]OLZ72888.1 hypothetical protein AV521_07985 [Streptomyces sp. IMTB 2501]
MALTYRELPNGWSVASVNRRETDYLYQEIFLDQTYQMGRELTTEQPVIFDVGANIGLFSLYAADRWPDSQIFAFEPAPAVYEALEENLRALKNISLFRVALGEQTEGREFSFYPGYTMMSGFDADPDADRALVRSFIENKATHIAEPARRAVLVDSATRLLEGKFKQQKFPVRVQRLADVATVHGVDRIDLLKVDVEGAELEVLRGVGEALWPNIDQVVVEVSDREGRLMTISELLTRHGMDIEIRQAPEYEGTELFMVFAWRSRKERARTDSVPMGR